MCKTLQERLAIASVIAMGINAKIEHGALNLAEAAGKGAQYDKMDSALEEVREVAELAATMFGEHATLDGMLKQLAYFRLVKNASKKHGVANCGEYAGYVFLKLYKKAVFPIAFVSAVNVKEYINHAFVVIGLESTEAKQDMATWGKDVVICDPWLMQLRAIMKSTKAEFAGAYTPTEYIETTKTYFRDGTKVERMFGADKGVGEVPKWKLG